MATPNLNGMSDADLLELSEFINMPRPSTSGTLHHQTVMEPPYQQQQQQQPPQKKKQSAPQRGTKRQYHHQGKQISDEIDLQFENIFKNYSNQKKKSVQEYSTLTRKLKSGMISLSAPISPDANYLVKIEIYKMSDIQNVDPKDIWRNALVRSKFHINNNTKLFSVINSTTLDVAQQLKSNSNVEEKFYNTKM